MSAVTKGHRLLTGRGQYVHVIALPGMLHAVFVRSVHARAKLLAVGLATAAACEGVVAVLDTSHLAGCAMPPVNPLLANTKAPDCPLLASSQVDSVGQPIAVVIATSLQAAQDAAEQVFIDYETLPALADLDSRAQDVAVVRHGTSDAQARAAMAAKATHNVHMLHRQPRVIAMSLEPRAAVAQWHADSGSITVWLPTQTPSRAQADVARTLGLPLDNVRVIAPDVGGAFGSKASVCPRIPTRRFTNTTAT